MVAQTQEKLWSKAFVGLGLTNMAMFVSFHMLNATFPFYIKELGGDEAIAGIATGLFSIAAVLLRPIIGWILDNKGRRIVLLVGLLGMLVLPISYLLITVLVLLIGLRVCHGVVWSCASTAVTTVAGDIIPHKRFGEGMGIFSTGAAVSMAVGPLLGLSVMNRLGFRSVFVTSALCAAIALLLVVRAKYVGSQATDERFDFKRSLHSLVDKDALPASVTMLLFIIPYGAVSTFIAMYALEIGLVNGGIFFLVMAAATFVMRLLIGRVVDKRGEGPIVLVGNLVLILSMVLLAFFPGNISFVVAAACYGIGFGMMPPTLQAMAMRIAPEHRRGAASSTFLCAFDLGMGLGGIIAGYLIRYFSYFSMYGLMIVFLVGCLAVYWWWARKSPSSFYNEAS